MTFHHADDEPSYRPAQDADDQRHRRRVRRPGPAVRRVIDGGEGRGVPSDDWANDIGAWAATALSGPQYIINNPIEEEPDMALNEAPPAPETGSARGTVTDHAVDAGERLLDAGNKVGNAYADAYQEAVISMADFQEKLTDAGVVDWQKLMPGADQAALAKPLREAASTAARVNEQLVSAGKQLGLACIEAYEQAMLSSVALQEQANAATDNKVMRSIGSTRAAVTRDVTRAYVEAARRLLA